MNGEGEMAPVPWDPEGLGEIKAQFQKAAFMRVRFWPPCCQGYRMSWPSPAFWGQVERQSVFTGTIGIRAHIPLGLKQPCHLLDLEVQAAETQA